MSESTIDTANRYSAPQDDKTVPRSNEYLVFDSIETAEEQQPSATDKVIKKKKRVKRTETIMEDYMVNNV